jgi:hypothetical protein
MAMCIPITLLERDGSKLTYEYTQPHLTPDPYNVQRVIRTGDFRGVVVFDQATGQFTQVAGAEWDNGRFYDRVCEKLGEHFRVGELPEVTAYAA